jgi:hypothetical protein
MATAKKRSRKANAQPAGGGGGGWKKFNEDKAKRDAKRLQALRAEERGESASLKDGLTFNTSAHPYDGATSEVAATGTSIFDPVLCELAYRWFCPPGGMVLDPFAGGSVRGIVASHLDRGYLGVDLRQEQVESNASQAEKICRKRKHQPEWVIGDALDLETVLPKDFPGADFVFSCPPYGDLEVYSDDPRDLSRMAHRDFIGAYRRIIGLACNRLKPNRFACFVVGDFRDEKGRYRNFPGDTIRAFMDCGMSLYNEAILITAAGSLPIRAGKQFESTRKLGKTHQNVLVFIKGDPVKATKDIGPCEFGMPNSDIEGAEDISVGERLTVESLGGEV